MGETVRKLEMEFTLAAQTQLTTRARTHSSTPAAEPTLACCVSTGEFDTMTAVGTFYLHTQPSPPFAPRPLWLVHPGFGATPVLPKAALHRPPPHLWMAAGCWVVGCVVCPIGFRAGASCQPRVAHSNAPIRRP